MTKSVVLVMSFVSGILIGATLVVTGVKEQTVAVALELPKLAEPKPAKILFVGDMQFDRRIRAIADEKGGDFIFSCVDPLLKNADLVVGNLEGPITDFPSISQGSVVGSAENYVFTFPAATAPLLVRHNIRLVDLGNNHITNFGVSGLQSTHDYLTQAGVGYFGGVVGSEPVYRNNMGGVPLSFVSYNEFLGQSPHEVAQVIAQEHQAGRMVIVFAHWGDEYVDSSARLRPVATLFAQSGANVIIGAHPHVVLPHETIGNTVVYYSLGNFIFDQYFNDNVREGLGVLLTISPLGVIGTQEYPLEIGFDGRTCTSAVI